MQHSHALRAMVCAACLLLGRAAFAQGAGGAAGAHLGVVKTAGFTPIAFSGHGGRGGGHGFGGGGRAMSANIGGARNFSTAGNWHGGHWNQGGGWNGGGWGGWGYPGFAYGYGYPDYAYDYPDYGYDYSYGPGVYGYDQYAAGEMGSYCQTPVRSCSLTQPSAVGSACQCRNGIDWAAGTVQP